jgi:molecular chaperone GrpE
MTKQKTKKQPNENTAKINQLEEKLARSLADYSNLCKRIESQKEAFYSIASASLMTKMIDVLDNFYLAYSHLKDEGLKMAINNFVSVLKSEGLEEIEAQDKDFDHNFMECVQTEKGPNDKVLKIVKKGYLLNGQCLRPVQVVVGQNKN